MELLGAVVSDYKSVGTCEVPLSGLTVLLGPNGVGKTNLIEAIGAYDPLAAESLAREGGGVPIPRARIGLVARFRYSAGGADAETLHQMIVSPWAAGMATDEITEGVGAYCGSMWWFDGGDLYSVASRSTLEACLSVIRRSLLAVVPAELLPTATELVELLLVDPVVVVQEDFAVVLSVDRKTDIGLRVMTLGQQLLPVLASGALSHVVGVLTSWTGRWPPLTVLTREPGGERSSPAGFGWATEQLGGVQVVSGDVRTLEEHLDAALPRVHDRLLHLPDEFPSADEVYDEACTACLSADHGGRVDPAFYDDPEGGWSSGYPGGSSWLETHHEWVRVRPSLSEALQVVQDSANARLVSFVADAGSVVLRIRPPADWEDGGPRCSVQFSFAPTGDEPAIADWDGPVGVRGYSTSGGGRRGLVIGVSDLGAGMRRWVAAALRLALEDLSANSNGMTGTPRIVLVDEPEQHLHPAAQHAVAAWCLQQSRANHTLLVATHSPSFLALPPEAATLCQVSRRGHQTYVQPLPAVHGQDVVQRARRLGFELGLGRDALAQLTRAVVVVEGEWDRRMLHAFFGDAFAQQRALVVPLQGSDELGGMADVAVIPALGVPVIALLDDIRASSAEDFGTLPGPLNKAERALRDLSAAIGPALSFVRYEDPDVICALPESAVRRAFPSARFPGWAQLLQEWETYCQDPSDAGSSGSESAEERHVFKRWAPRAMGVAKRDRKPASFFAKVLSACEPGDRPGRRFAAAAQQALALIDPQRVP